MWEHREADAHLETEVPCFPGPDTVRFLCDVMAGLPQPSCTIGYTTKLPHPWEKLRCLSSKSCSSWTEELLSSLHSGLRGSLLVGHLRCSPGGSCQMHEKGECPGGRKRNGHSSHSDTLASADPVDCQQLQVCGQQTPAKTYLFVIVHNKE